MRKTALYFSSEYLDRVNALHLWPLDWDLWLALKARPRAQRLYELFQTALTKPPYPSRLCYDYGDLCDRLSLRRKDRLTDSFRALDVVHDALQGIPVRRGPIVVRARVLDRVAWTWDGTTAKVDYVFDRGYLQSLRSWRLPASILPLLPRAAHVSRL
jgi:hypothetical protein